MNCNISTDLVICLEPSGSPICSTFSIIFPNRSPKTPIGPFWEKPIPDRPRTSSCEGDNGAISSAPNNFAISALRPLDGSSAGLLFEGILLNHMLNENVAMSSDTTEV